MKKNFLGQITMGLIVVILLTLSNKVFEFYPSFYTAAAVIIFDLMIAFVLLRLAFKELKIYQIISRFLSRY